MRMLLGVAAMAFGMMTSGTAYTETQVPNAVEHWVEPDGPGEYRLHVHERRAVSSCDQPPVLLLHGYGVPTAMAFDVPGASLMEHLARTGRSSFAVDLPGFGLSERPAEMDAPPAGAPILRAADVLKDVGRAVRYVQSVCPGSKVDVVGWSWGGVVAAMWASAQPADLRRLVLIDSMYSLHVPSITRLFADPGDPDRLNPKLPSYNVVPVKSIVDQWNAMLDTTGLSHDALRDPDILKGVSDVFLDSDPARPSPGAVRRPLGPIVDLFEIFSGRPVYDASRIIAPTFVVHGDADNFSDSFSSRLSQSCGRRELIIGDGTHYLIFEKARYQVYAALDDFLSTSLPACGARQTKEHHED
jgi:alpha-beta hydrolase superfamily lysophospholipase